MLSVHVLYEEFCNSKFDDQPVEDARGRAFAIVKVGSSRSTPRTSQESKLYA